MALPQDTQLVETLGEGSFSVVYVARVRDGAMLRTVVLKVLKSAWAEDEETIGRARDEAAMLARLQHANIIRVEQLTALQGHTAVVMEYVRGLTLDRVLDQAGPMPVEVALSITHKIADALDSAFNQVPPGMSGPLRVVHRDIKPSNVILGVGGEVKVLDFGTARAELMERNAETGSVTPGSPLYMAPERFDGLSRGAEVDIYSLGCTLYELITGRPLGRLSVHPSRHEKEVAEKVQALSPPDLEEGIVLAMLRSLIQRALSYEPAHRPTAAEARALCASLAKRLPGVRMTRRQYCEGVVSPLYAARERLPPVPLDGTLDPRALAVAVDEAQREALTEEQITRPPDDPAPLQDSATDHGGATQPLTPSRRRPLGLLLGTVTALLIGVLTLGLLVTRSKEAPQVSPPESVQEVLKVPLAPLASEETPAGPDVRLPASDPEPELAPASESEPQAAPSPAAAPPAAKSAPKSPKEAVTKPRAAPAPAPDVEPESESEAPAEVPVLIKVVSAPAGAVVEIGGQSTGTPGQLRLVPGSHKARVQFADGLSARCTVDVVESGRLVFRGTGGSVTCP